MSPRHSRCCWTSCPVHPPPRQPAGHRCYRRRAATSVRPVVVKREKGGIRQYVTSFQREKRIVNECARPRSRGVGVWLFFFFFVFCLQEFFLGSVRGEKIKINKKNPPCVPLTLACALPPEYPTVGSRRATGSQNTATTTGETR